MTAISTGARSRRARSSRSRTASSSPPVPTSRRRPTASRARCARRTRASSPSSPAPTCRGGREPHDRTRARQVPRQHRSHAAQRRPARVLLYHQCGITPQPRRSSDDFVAAFLYGVSNGACCPLFPSPASGYRSASPRIAGVNMALVALCFRPLREGTQVRSRMFASPMRGGAPKGRRGGAHGRESQRAVSPLRVRSRSPTSPARGGEERRTAPFLVRLIFAGRLAAGRTAEARREKRQPLPGAPTPQPPCGGSSPAREPEHSPLREKTVRHNHNSL